MSGISGAGSSAGHSSYQAGFAGSRSTAAEEIPGPGTVPFLWYKRQQNPAWVRRGCSRCILTSSGQHPSLWSRDGHHGTRHPSSSSLHTRKDQWGWGLPLNHEVWCSTVALLLEPTARIPPARAGRMPWGSGNQLLGFSPSLFPSRY